MDTDDDKRRKLAELEEAIRKQDERDANMRDADRLELLDRIADRMPEIDLDEQSVEWKTLDDDVEALLINGGGVDGGVAGAMVTSYRDDLHVTGSLASL